MGVFFVSADSTGVSDAGRTVTREMWRGGQLGGGEKLAGRKPGTYKGKKEG